ncbi:Intracellular proteinase inhibitor [Gracilibacillus orientalis]|uniref:Intracellular proteinase inhibitor n=1 Tax=Gracilibacillus orientalis TaxID=334253 RepID=A0A1I4H6X0_9BACI|nr:BsuPI-related putative proteinase inhibitor [Gracilibacillus orientalis]SFL37131.1 Intracellular proteinase inhibitor [Gracilibacillus orientalis]
MKKYFSLISIILMFLLMACGTADVNQEETTGSEPEDTPVDSTEEESSETEDLSAIMENLDLQVAAEQQGTSIDFTFQLINQNEDTVDFMFTSSQQFEIKLFQEDELIYQYSDGKMFTQALAEESLAPGEAKNWTESWESSEPLEPGEYEVEMTLIPAEINGQEIDGEPLQQTITITLEEMESDNSTEGPFRSVESEGKNGEYIVTGEVDTSVGVTYYEVEDGHNYLIEQTEIPVEGDGWQEFEINVSIAEDLLPQNGAVVMLLYTEERSEQMPVQLEVTP